MPLNEYQSQSYTLQSSFIHCTWAIKQVNPDIMETHLNSADEW